MKQRGFTFVELLVVITIIAVLTAVGVVSYQSTNRSSRDAKRKADLENIRSALEICRLEDGVYPADDGGYVPDPIACNSSVSMNDVPVDPKNNSLRYEYNRDTNVTYRLRAQLEKDNGMDYELTNP